VQVRPGGPDFNGIEELVSRRADVALVDAAYIAMAIDSGLNLTVVGNYLQTSPIKLASLDKDLTVQELEGKNVGVWCCGFDIPIRMMLKTAGINANYVSQSWTLNQLYDGSIDAASVMVYNELAMALQVVDDKTNFLRQRADVSELSPSDLDVPFMHNTVVVLTERLDELKDSLERMFRIVSRTWLFCRENERACVKSYPRSNAHYDWQLREMLKVIFPSPDGLGVTVAAQWDGMVDFLVANGVLSKKIHSQDVIDNSMILASHSDPLYDAAKVNEPLDLIPFNFCAAYGSDFYVACETDNFEHTFCPVGHHPVGPVDSTACASCAAGKFSYNPDSQLTGTGGKKDCAPQCGRGC
jgi:NitT/TauT family transport system substrate-binding protein